MSTQEIILASGSVYRQALLAKIQLPFKSESPNIDETLQPHELPFTAAVRLATAKALALAHKYPRHLIIGSDQVAILDGQQLGKPGNSDSTIAQLLSVSGKKIEFYTGVCVLNSQNGLKLTDIDQCSVFFRELSRQQIESYVTREKPYDCAGGFKAEGLGIALFERIDSNDPNSLIGLPLIKLISLLNRFGVKVI